ncbi:hypothetical protein BC834DRAFT_869605 [Gloeopeniophorella convolvens]|nr:hypothetical protein BC834DRAFT_869605 [Gloeopeniophorella convolvens]
MEDPPISQEPPSNIASVTPTDLERTQQIIPTSKKRALGLHHDSPSSPDLKIRPSLPAIHVPSTSLSRTRTLPLKSPKYKLSNVPTLEGVTFEVESRERLRQWVLGLAIVDFDLEQGPSLSCIFPSLPLYPFEAENIAFSAFPDSTLFKEGSETHSFRIREQGSNTAHSNRSSFDDRRAPSPDGFLYGFSHFNQVKSAASKRGYSQRCIVVLTQHPYPALFHALLDKLGPLYHSHGEPIIEVASHNIAKWPSPAPGSTAELGFLGSVWHVRLPRDADEQQLSNAAQPDAQADHDWHIFPCSPPISAQNIVRLFEASISHMWSIWECLILGEPIIIFGQSPAWTSQAVWWLRDVFRPIPWAGDFRPYFTIHDKDHAVLVNERAPKAGLLLGVTNPFFEKACSHWPHVLSLGGKSSIQSPSTRGAGPPPGWKTKTHKRHISKDRQLLQQLEAVVGNGDAKSLEEASFNLRRHFSSRSAAVLVPLNRYLNTLIPRPSEASTDMRLKPFNNANFFASLKTHGAALPFRSSTKQREFYERWLRTPAFGQWLARQEEIVGRTLAENAGRGAGR